jgi:excinuclease ABC subunit C
MTFDEMILSAPHNPGVYKMYDQDGVLLYVGKAKDLIKRLKQYVDISKLEYHKVLMRRLVVRVEWETVPTESDALILEQRLIKTLHPKYNIILKDDKMYPFLALSDDKFPRLYKFRSKIMPAKNVWGPFPFVSDLKDIMIRVQKSAKIRTCTNNVFNSHKLKPCILFQLGRCSGPCCMPNPDYKKQIGLAKRIIRLQIDAGQSDNKLAIIDKGEKKDKEKKI